MDVISVASPDNVGITLRALDAYNRWEVEPMLEDLDPEVEWRPAIPMLLGGEATVYRGHEGVRALFREIRDAFAEIRIEFSEVRDLGDRVVAVGHMRARGKASGAETQTPWAYLAELRDGKGLRIQTYLDPEEALEAAGVGT
jgi:ketosteroid isomerase-like protein